MRLRTVLYLGLIGLLTLLSSLPLLHVQGQSTGISSVYVDPLESYGSPGVTININVTMNLASGEMINGFDIRLNYTNPYSPNTGQGVVSAVRIDYSRNVFTSYNASRVLAECIDGVAIVDQGCPSSDFLGLGQIHFAQLILNATVQGPVSALLFSVQIQIWGYGVSIFSFDRANLLNPGSDPSNPQILNSHFIQVVTSAGVFGNSGVVAFFNFLGLFGSEPYPAILPGPLYSVRFDATGSFNAAYPTGVKDMNYTWDFGDGTSSLRNQTTPVALHAFALPGKYNVQLSVTDLKNGGSKSIFRTVVVVRALGSLSLTVNDQNGTPIRGSVLVRIFNSTASSSPFLNKTIDQAGGVVFQGLLAGTYFVKLSGASVEDSSRTENVVAGWTTQDTVYMRLRLAPPDYGAAIFLGSIFGGLALATVAIVKQSRKSQGRRVKAGYDSRRRG